MHLRQSALTYSACGPFTKNKKEYKKLRKQGIQDIFYENKIEKACFQHNMAYADFKDLPRKIISDNVFIYIYIYIYIYIFIYMFEITFTKH